MRSVSAVWNGDPGDARCIVLRQAITNVNAARTRDEQHNATVTVIYAGVPEDVDRIELADKGSPMGDVCHVYAYPSHMRFAMAEFRALDVIVYYGEQGLANIRIEDDDHA